MLILPYAHAGVSHTILAFSARFLAELVEITRIDSAAPTIIVRIVTETGRRDGAFSPWAKIRT